MKNIKNNQLSHEIGASVAILAVLALLIHPYWMPMGLVVVFIGVLAVLVFGLGIFVWHETPRDEREHASIAQNGRTAYLLGAAILTIGVAVQTYQHQLDIWLVLALACMILSKLVTNFRNR